MALTPLATYGLLELLGLWHDDVSYRDYYRNIEWHWIYIELSTLAVAAVLAWKYKYPFLMMPVAITLWFMSMDVTMFFFGEDYDWHARQLVSMVSGVFMISLAFWIDLRSRNKADYAFWLYMFGSVVFWGSISINLTGEINRFIYFIVNLAMIGIGVLLVRRVFVVLGFMGFFYYLIELASNVFKDSLLFPIILTVLGLGVVYLGVWWQKNEARITAKIRNVLPVALRELLESKMK